MNKNSVDKKFELELGGRKLIIEIRDLAGQANGSVFVRYGDTMLLATAVMSRQEKPDMGFFPLMVDYEERYYAAGKIKGPKYIKREGRPSDEAICNARLIDRAIRPLFPEELTREVQVVITVLSFDGQNEPDLLGMIGASLALSISDIPWSGPLAALRIGGDENQFILNPPYSEEREKSKLDIVFSFTKDKGETLINMIEGKFNEAGEELIQKSWSWLQPHLDKVVDFQDKIIKEVRKEKAIFPAPPDNSETENSIKEFLNKKLEGAVFPARNASHSDAGGQKKKGERNNAVEQLKDEMIAFVKEKFPEKIGCAQKLFDKEIDKLVHEKAINDDARADGRKMDEVRELYCEVGLLPRTHGSGVFCRGETKSLSILTLGAPGDQQMLEGMEITGKKRFMHHYNFPPYSTGEVKPMRGPGRREIGHGMLAEKALLPLIPSVDQFPYTIRVVSEVLSSNGSSSMASVCAASLALMDAGVPIKAPAAGISLGLMSEMRVTGKSAAEANYKILTDIQGPEDHHGDMDFKIAGTREGITVVQMDVK
ncbi:MAG: polyribonucleotide nucleotidyltransferase, partial [Candidatus Wildermuthbacteria bacterium]|nr:polyribonucleotide nucleotidyltransferase [Candidatus Wildermuthbacteria bacterium]